MSVPLRARPVPEAAQHASKDLVRARFLREFWFWRDPSTLIGTLKDPLKDPLIDPVRDPFKEPINSRISFRNPDRKPVLVPVHYP